jgi:hypothetical protein
VGSVAPPTDGAAAAAGSASAGDQLSLGVPAPAVQELTLEEELALVRNMNMAKSSKDGTLRLTPLMLARGDAGNRVKSRPSADWVMNLRQHCDVFHQLSMLQACKDCA